MNFPSKLFLILVTIVVIVTTIFCFASAVNFKNAAEGDKEPSEVSADTANSLSTMNIIFGIIFGIIAIWMAYKFLYYEQEVTMFEIKQGNAIARQISIMQTPEFQKARDSVAKFESLKTKYYDLLEKAKKSLAEKDSKLLDLEKKYDAWNYCPDPLIKVTIKDDLGEIERPYYENGKLKGFIVKPKADNEECGVFKPVNFEMETQKCYQIQNKQNVQQPMQLGYQAPDKLSPSFVPSNIARNLPAGYTVNKPSGQNLIGPGMQPQGQRLLGPGIQQPLLGSCGPGETCTQGLFTKKAITVGGVSFKPCGGYQSGFSGFGFPTIQKPQQNQPPKMLIAGPST